MDEQNNTLKNDEFCSLCWNKPRNSTKMNVPCHIVLEKYREEEKEGKRGKSELIGGNEWKEKQTDGDAITSLSL